MQKSHHHLLDHCQELLSSLLFHCFVQRLHCHLKCSFLWRSTKHLRWKTSLHLDIWKCQQLQNMGAVPRKEGMIRVNNLATGRFSLGPLVSVAARVTHLVHQHLILHVGLAVPLLTLRYIQIALRELHSLILCKELSSSIFESLWATEWLNKASVRPDQIGIEF